MAVKGRRPILALVVDIDEVFHHCAKAFLRSKLWRPAVLGGPGRRPAQSSPRPSSAQDKSLAELTEYYGPSYAEKLY